MRLNWTPALATGIRQIDLQHQELIDIINELEAAHVAGEQARALDEVLPRLSAYVLFHFGTEEAMMAGLRGAERHAERHTAEHREFAAEVAAVAALRGGPDAGVDLTALLDYLKRWLLGHIMQTDRELATLLA